MTYRKISLWFLAGSVAALVALCVASWHRSYQVGHAEGHGGPALSVTVVFSTLRIKAQEAGPPRPGLLWHVLPVPESVRNEVRKEGYTGKFSRQRALAQIGPGDNRYYTDFLVVPLWWPWLAFTGGVIGTLLLLGRSSARKRSGELAACGGDG